MNVTVFTFRLLHGSPDVAMDAIVHIAQNITPAKRNDLSRVLADLDTIQPSESDSTPPSPSPSRSSSNPFYASSSDSNEKI